MSTILTSPLMNYQYIHRLVILLNSSEKFHFPETQKQNWSPCKEKDTVDIYTTPTIQESSWKRGSKDQRQWMTTLKQCFKITRGSLHICHSGCDSMHKTCSKSSQTKSDVRSYLKLMAAQRERVCFFKDAAPEIGSYTLTHPDSNE